jgi:hypothetical protein
MPVAPHDGDVRRDDRSYYIQIKIQSRCPPPERQSASRRVEAALRSIAEMPFSLLRVPSVHPAQKQSGGRPEW